MKFLLKPATILFIILQGAVWNGLVSQPARPGELLTSLCLESDLIIHAKVYQQHSGWIIDERGRNIHTTTTLQILSVIKGSIDNPGFIDYSCIGGTVGDTSQFVSSAVTLEPEEELVLFMHGNPRRITHGYSGKWLIQDGLTLLDNHIIPVNQLIETINRSEEDPDVIPRFYRKITGESFGTDPADTFKQLKSSSQSSTESFSLTGKISDFAGSTDSDGDGFFEALSFRIGIDGYADPGPDTVFFRIVCPTTGQSWFSDQSYVIDNLTEEYFEFLFDESRFAGHFSGPTQLDFKVELWDSLKQNILAADETIDNEPIKIEEPIPPAVIISSISPDKTSAGTNSVVTITGSNFGATRGTGKVEFFYKVSQPKIAATVISWSDNQITCTVPIGSVNGYPGSAGSGPVTVTTGTGQQSNGYPFSVTFGYGGYRWQNPTVLVKVNENYPGLSTEGLSIQNGMNTWNEAQSNLVFQYDGTHNQTSSSKNSINEIMWGYLNTSSLAETSIWTSGGYIVECDIAFDLYQNWTQTPGSPGSAYDLETTAVHELGHWLNLRDIYGNLNSEYDRQKIMYGISDAGQSKRNLHSDDIAGIHWIYGEVSEFEVTGHIKTAAQVALPGVILNGLPGAPVTDAQGYYSDHVPAGWSGTVTPEKSGYTFTPTSTNYQAVSSDQTSQNYTAVQLGSDATLSDLQVSGTTLTGFSPGTLVYSIQVPYGTTVVPTVTAVTSDPRATKVITPADFLPGTTRIEVTAENGTTKKVYTVTFLVAAPSTNATLSDLKVDNSSIPEFSPGTLGYVIVLPHGSLVVPTVSASVSHSGASLEIVPATSLPGSTLIRVTAQDGITQLVYVIEFQVAKNNDATLATIVVDGLPLAGFDPAALLYSIELPFGTTVIPTIAATANDPNAALILTLAPSLPGTTTIQVIAENGTTTQTYSVEFRLTTPSTDASLSDLRLDATTLLEFDPEITYYSRILPRGTTAPPTVTATTNHPEANLIIYPAEDLPGTANVVVTAQDGFTRRTYSIAFELAKNNDATLSGLQIAGTPLDGFLSSQYIYNKELPFGTFLVPTVTATPSDPVAMVQISPAIGIPGVTTILVTAEDNVTQLSYVVNFTLTPPSSDATLASLNIAGNPFPGFNPAITNYAFELPHGSTVLPEISAIANFPQATVAILPATEIPGTSMVIVTAQDGQTKIAYLIAFTIAKSKNASLSNLIIDGSPLPDFSSDNLNYEYVVASGTLFIPEVIALAADSLAQVSIHPAAFIPDTTRIQVIAEDGLNQRTYRVYIRYPLAGIRQDVSMPSPHVYPNPNNGTFFIQYESLNRSSLQIIILDLFGRTVFEKQIIPVDLQVKERITIPGIPAGIYLIRLNNGYPVISKKLVIE